MSTSSRLRGVAAVLAAALVAAGTTGSAVASDGTAEAGDGAPDPTSAAGPGAYIVTLDQEPSAVYDGGTDGFAATRAMDGQRFDRTRTAVVAYESHLRERQDRLLSRIGNPAVLYQMATAVDGFVARLNGGQVKELRANKGVALVERSTRQQLDTVDSPDFLELPRTWARQGGPADAGDGAVIGVVDSGIWPENPSFAGLPQKAARVSEELQGFHGACARAEEWSPENCNEKVVSARYFVKGFGVGNVAESEFRSPRDGSGHGSHTASVAAGNDDVAVEIERQRFGTASGMAPAASIAAYKACWAAPNPAFDGCATADTVAAIDQAVADGVDVLNYSISGPADTVADSVEQAFLNAAAGGVFVAASAGNQGPRAGTVGHSGPWVTTVGSSTHRLLQGAVRLGNGDVHAGAMVADEAVGRARLVLGSSVAAEGASTAQARICEIDSLDSSAAANRIVVCDRGATSRVDKSAAVARAGGAAMVLANVHPDSRDADFHSVPTVHLDAAAADEIKSYVRAEGRDANASLDPDGSERSPVPNAAEFSSRGPSAVRGGDLLKPDITAPGVGVVAAVAPPTSSGRLWDLRSGSSTSAAHVAGLAAFLVGVKPQWSPARVKSAMMTTASDLTGGADPLTQGAGHVRPARFLDPGLVYDTSPDDWVDFLAGRARARDLNQPSITLGALTGRTMVSRTVTNVSGERETYRATVSGLNGVSATVTPATMTLAPRASRRFTVRFAAEPGAPVGSYSGGALTWVAQTTRTRARIPLAVRTQISSAPEEVTGLRRSGKLRVEGRSGRTGSISLRTSGLTGARPTPVSLVPGPFDPTSPSRDSDTLMTTVTVPPGADLARFELDAHNKADDLDVFAYLDGDLVAQSATDSADEQVTLVEPHPGTYRIYVSSSSAANGSTTTGQLYAWAVTPGDGANLELDPGTVRTTAGDRFRYRASWKGLDMTERWFGAIRYAESDRRTLVSIK
ncbi:MAG TPA: S8 family serine peptidase [Nocardioidaceae bacterium]|nr:S8 family serine peptidase [Nocardioidaceae bacterium]